MAQSKIGDFASICSFKLGKDNSPFALRVCQIAPAVVPISSCIFRSHKPTSNECRRAFAEARFRSDSGKHAKSSTISDGAPDEALKLVKRPAFGCEKTNSGVDFRPMFSKLNAPTKIKSDIEASGKPLPKGTPVVEPGPKVTPGQYLKAVRERLQIGMREVQDASMIIASEEGNENFYISAARLTQIENEESVPSFFKLFSLCSVFMGSI